MIPDYDGRFQFSIFMMVFVAIQGVQKPGRLLLVPKLFLDNFLELSRSIWVNLGPAIDSLDPLGAHHSPSSAAISCATGRTSGKQCATSRFTFVVNKPPFPSLVYIGHVLR
jgi:hypothetical protein